MTRCPSHGVLALVLLSLLTIRSPALADPIDDYIQSEMKARRIPGLALAVTRHGVITKMQAYGIANLEHDVLYVGGPTINPGAAHPVAHR